jgi:hypothetical protein
MQTSIFLAKLIGPTALLIGLVILLNPSRVKAMAREVLQGEAFIFLAGIITLPVGLALVNTHNIWTWDWRVVITLLGWLSVIGGASRLAFGDQVKAIGAKMIDNKSGLVVQGALMSLIGAWLSYVGYLS